MSLLSVISRRSFMGFVAAAMLAGFFAVSSAQAGQVESVSSFIQNLGDKAISILADKSMSKEDAARKFRNMLTDSFDLEMLGKFALGGSTWKSATPAQREEYLKLFEKLVVQIYNDRFSLYNGEVWKVVDAHAEDGKDTYVSGHIVKPDSAGQPVKVDWRVRNKGGKPKVVDVIVEGISMTVTQRSEFAAVIQKNGGDMGAFLKTLSERVAATSQ